MPFLEKSQHAPPGLSHLRLGVKEAGQGHAPFGLTTNFNYLLTLVVSFIEELIKKSFPFL